MFNTTNQLEKYYLDSSLSLQYAAIMLNTHRLRLWHHAGRHVGAPLHFKMAAKNGAVVSLFTREMLCYVPV